MKNSITMSAAAIVVTAGLASANILQNGSFEQTANLPAQGWLTVETGNAAIGGWNVMQGSVDLVGSSLWTAADGNVSLDMAGVAGGMIEQSFATEAGREYQVSFDVSGNFGGYEDMVKTLSAEVAGVSNTYTVDATGNSAADMNWERHTFTFTADGSLSTLKFQDMHNELWGAVLDNVDVQLVPAPGAVALGLLGFGAMARRRRLA